MKNVVDRDELTDGLDRWRRHHDGINDALAIALRQSESTAEKKQYEEMKEHACHKASKEVMTTGNHPVFNWVALEESATIRIYYIILRRVNMYDRGYAFWGTHFFLASCDSCNA